MLKNSKNWHFFKWVSPWFWSKIVHFQPFIFRQYIGRTNVFYNLVEGKNAFLAFENKNLKKSKDWHFSKGVSPWFLSKIGQFSTSSCLGNMCQKNVFYDLLERKNDFLGYKKRKMKMSKNWHFFAKGLVHGFGPKLAIFHLFFLATI